jgi:hypothetical protein
MARQFSTKRRGTEKFSTNPVIVMIVEGHNMTETLYFRQFNKQRAGYSIKLLASGSSTDPEGMLANLDRFWLSNDLDPKRGDRGFIVLEQVRPGFQKTGLQRISGMQGNMLQD